MPKRRQGTVAEPTDQAAKVGAVGRIEVRINGIAVDIPPELAATQRAYRGSIQPLAAEMTTTQAAEVGAVGRIEVRINGIAVDIPPELAATQRAYRGSIQPLAAEMTTTQAA